MEARRNQIKKQLVSFNLNQLLSTSLRSKVFSLLIAMGHVFSMFFDHIEDKGCIVIKE